MSLDCIVCVALTPCRPSSSWPWQWLKARLHWKLRPEQCLTWLASVLTNEIVEVKEVSENRPQSEKVVSPSHLWLDFSPTSGSPAQRLLQTLVQTQSQWLLAGHHPVILVFHKWWRSRNRLIWLLIWLVNDPQNVIQTLVRTFFEHTSQFKNATAFGWGMSPKYNKKNMTTRNSFFFVLWKVLLTPVPISRTFVWLFLRMNGSFINWS